MSIMSREDTIFVCPQCRLKLKREDDYFLCTSCANKYPIVDAIPDFRNSDEYWCNVSREKMQLLNKLAKEKNDWIGAARKIVPEYMEHFCGFERADMQFMLPIDSASRILDAGAMWGGLSIPLAQYCKEVVSLDKTLETLQYLSIRCAQEMISNIRVVASPLKMMPFRDNYFDCVVLNGVLEWVGFEDDLILEKHWGKRREKTVRYKSSPRDSQLRVLKEIRRVLKPQGCLFLAIENRYGYPYFIGHPDDHINIRFVPILPRFLANAVTKIKINMTYRTYIYGINGLSRLLKKSGFDHNKFHAVFPHYTMPDTVMPLSLVGRWFSRIVKPKQWYKKAILNILPRNLCRYFSPSFMVVSHKDGKGRDGRIVNILKEVRLIPQKSKMIRIIKQGGRPGGFLTANFLLYTNNSETPSLFCKVCRDKKHIDVLQDEYNNLNLVHNLFLDSQLSKSLPKLDFFGTVDGLTVLLTKYKTGNNRQINITQYSKPEVLIKRVSFFIDRCIEYLVKFQKHTQIKEISAQSVFCEIISKQKRILRGRKLFDEETEKLFNDFKSGIERIDDARIPICAVHGDYDVCNIKIINDRIHIFDLEHFSAQGMPFFDLSNLLFNIFLVNENFKNKEMNSANSVLNDFSVNLFLKEKLRYYSQLSGIPKELFNLFGPISVLEHRERMYPYYRDPDTYPLHKYNLFKSLMNWRIEL